MRPRNTETFMSESSAAPFAFHMAVYDFMHIAGDTVYGFNAEQATRYTGYQLEELSEKIEAIAGGCVTVEAAAHLMKLAGVMRNYSAEFKAGMHQGDILRANHAELIDADFDLAWVGLAGLYSTAVRPLFAIQEGSKSNLAKFPGGVCTRDAQRKIMKPAGWAPPNFEQFVDPKYMNQRNT